MLINLVGYVLGRMPTRLASKSRTGLTGPTDDILCPKFVKQLDYEEELAFVNGRDQK